MWFNTQVPHDDWSFNNISNIKRYLYEKPPYNNRQCDLTHRYLTMIVVFQSGQDIGQQITND